MITPPSSTSVVVIDDHPLFRDGVCPIIDADPRFTLAGTADTADLATSLITRIRPDIALLDFHLPDGSGLEVIRQTRQTSPETKHVMLTAFHDDDVLFDALSLGVSGFLQKRTSGEALIESLRRVADGGSVIDPAMTGRVLDRIRHPRPKGDEKLSLLNPMEHKVLHLVSQGLTNKQIAPLIHVSDTSVKNYVSGILRKLGLSRRTEAAVYALSHSSDTAPS